MRQVLLILGWLAATGAPAAPAAPAIDPLLRELQVRPDVGLLSEAAFQAFAGCIERGEARCIAAVGALRLAAMPSAAKR